METGSIEISLGLVIIAINMLILSQVFKLNGEATAARVARYVSRSVALFSAVLLIYTLVF